MVDSVTKAGGGFGGASRIVSMAMLLLALCACNTILEPLVGENAKTKTAKEAPPPLPPSTAAFVSGTPISGLYAGTGILPPTLPMDLPAGEGPDLPAHRESRRPIAVAPLSPDRAKLAGLTTVARETITEADTRFVLLVLAPPANNAASLDRINSTARASAAAAIEALRAAGIASDRIEISMATNPDVGAGEMRLYQR